jgi:hypothetical protein
MVGSVREEKPRRDPKATRLWGAHVHHKGVCVGVEYKQDLSKQGKKAELVQAQRIKYYQLAFGD